MTSIRRILALCLVSILLAGVATASAGAHATKPPSNLKLTWPSKSKCPHRYVVKLWSDAMAYGNVNTILVRVFDPGFLWQPNAKTVWIYHAFGQDKKGE